MFDQLGWGRRVFILVLKSVTDGPSCTWGQDRLDELYGEACILTNKEVRTYLQKAQHLELVL
jgi:hypothetical protein